MYASALCRLCEKTTGYGDAGGFSSTGVELNATEFAAVLVGLSDPAVNLARAKYVGDVGALAGLRNHARVYAIGLAVEQGWKIVRGKPVVYNMGDLASIEAVGATVCVSCRGIGLAGGRCQCGSGAKKINDSLRARFIGVDRSNYGKFWSGRYEQLFRYLCCFEDELSRAISRQ